MLRCPHCKEPALTIWALSNSSILFPARCRACGAFARSGVSGIFSALIGQVLLVLGAAASLTRGSWWPLIASFLIFSLIHTAISAWSAPVAVAHPRPMPKWFKVGLWLLFLYVAISALLLSFDLLGWPN